MSNEDIVMFVFTDLISLLSLRSLVVFQGRQRMSACEKQSSERNNNSFAAK